MTRSVAAPSWPARLTGGTFRYVTCMPCMHHLLFKLSKVNHFGRECILSFWTRAPCLRSTVFGLMNLNVRVPLKRLHAFEVLRIKRLLHNLDRDSTIKTIALV